MLVAIGEAAASAVLLVGPQHDADRPARPQIQLLHDAQRFPRHDAAAAIVGRAGADVPRVEVAADDDDFVGFFASANLADDVGRLGVGVEMRLHLQPDDDRVAAVGHALQPVGVFGRDGRCRDLRRVSRVLQRAGVRRAQAGGPTDRTSTRDRAEPAPPATARPSGSAPFRRNW